MEDRQGVAVAGTHGKTTITAMIAWLLVRLGQDPSYIIGGTAKNLAGKNAHAGKGRALVVEADEYDRMFLGLTPDLIVISSLEHDHPDCFPTPQEYTAAFEEFVRRLRPGGVLLTAHGIPATGRLELAMTTGARAYTYGSSPEASYTANGLVSNARGGYDYEAWAPTSGGGKTLLAKVSLQVPGEHNARNSLAALAAVHQLGLAGATAGTWQEAAQALSEFTGTGRRFDLIGTVDGISIIDDYAHNPAKIQATLAAARSRYPDRRIWAVWQPHTFSRTLAFAEDFERSFGAADRVIVTEVYPAREKAADFGNYSAAQIAAQFGQTGVQFLPTLKETTRFLIDQLQPGDVLLVLSAGDADQISAGVLAGLKERSRPNA